MKKSISFKIVKIAQELIKIEKGLDPEDVSILKLDGPTYMRKVQTNLKLGKSPLAEFDDTGKKVLLAYVIFLRQNVTMEQGDTPNEEDTAKVLRGEVCTKNDEELDKELLKQLEKVGISVSQNKSDDKKEPKKKDKGK